MHNNTLYTQESLLLHNNHTLLEITSLPQEATVCSYCGVSYLIHHEIKRLEQELKESCERLVTVLLYSDVKTVSWHNYFNAPICRYYVIVLTISLEE